jgi:catechol 2,3-dioxygenase-like lactoylglutathione lyase family enzyme
MDMMKFPGSPRGFHHVALKARDFDATVDFYTRVLGLEPRHTWGQGDRRAVMLDTGDGSCLEVFAGGVDLPRPEGAILHFALRCDNVDAAIERVRAAGAEITMEPKDVDIQSQPVLPVRIAFFKGPDGEMVEFFQVRGH